MATVTDVLSKAAIKEGAQHFGVHWWNAREKYPSASQRDGFGWVYGLESKEETAKEARTAVRKYLQEVSASCRL